MKRFFSMFVILSLLLCLIPSQALATEVSTTQTITYFEDGSYLVTVTEEVTTWATRTKNSTKSDTYYDSSDVAQWKVLLSGMFKYDGTSATCTDSTCITTVYDTVEWYVVSEVEEMHDNVASCTVTMGKRILGITIANMPHTVTITCDKDGNCT